MKKVILGLAILLFSGILMLTTVCVMIIAVIGNNQNVGAFQDDGTVERFNITGAQDGNEFILNFTSSNWELNDIHLTLDKKKGIATAVVPMGGSAAAASGAAGAAIEWATAIANDNSYTYGHGSFNCCICRKLGFKKFTCMPFLAAAYAHGTNDPYLMKDGRHVMNLHDGNFKGKLGNYWTKVGLCKDLTINDLQPGDVVIKWSDDNAHGHAWMFGGDDKIIEAVPSDIHVIDGAAKKLKRYGSKEGNTSKNYVMRFTGGSDSSVALGGISHSAQDVKEGACLWAEAAAADDSFHRGCGADASKPGCYFCGTNAAKSDEIVGKDRAYSGNAFVTAAFAHGGGEPTMLKACQSGDFFSQGKSSDKLTFHGSPLFKDMGKPKHRNLERGDVLCKADSVYIYLGSGKCAYVGAQDDNVPGSERWNASIRIVDGYGKYTKVYRYVGNGGGNMNVQGGAGINYTKKPSGTILDTIDSNTGARVKLVNGSEYDVAQSFAHVKDGYAVAFTDANSTGMGEIRYYDDQGSYRSSITSRIYHANGSCGTGDNGMICAGTLVSTGKRGTKFNFRTGRPLEEQTLTLPYKTSSIAYDRDTESYICAAGRTMAVSKNLKNIIRTISRREHGKYYQDIGAGGGFVFACHTIKKGGENSGENYIDVYNESTSEYCGSYKVSYGELESVDIVNGELVLLVHIKGTETNYIHFTGIGGNGSGQAELAINYVKQSNGLIVFRGTLNGGNIVGQFGQAAGGSGEIIPGYGFYGGPAIMNGSFGSAGNPFGDKKFFVTGLACAYESGHASSFHYGWDLQCTTDLNAPIYAVSPGEVVVAGPYGAYGANCVIIKSGDMYVLYGHMSSKTVTQGSTVKAGQQIGTQGGYGSSGPNDYASHLHLEFRKGHNTQNSAVKNSEAMQPVFQTYANNWNEIKDCMNATYSPLSY